VSGNAEAEECARLFVIAAVDVVHHAIQLPQQQSRNVACPICSLRRSRFSPAHTCHPFRRRRAVPALQNSIKDAARRRHACRSRLFYATFERRRDGGRRKEGWRIVRYSRRAARGAKSTERRRRDDAYTTLIVPHALRETGTAGGSSCQRERKSGDVIAQPPFYLSRCHGAVLELRVVPARDALPHLSPRVRLMPRRPALQERRCAHA